MQAGHILIRWQRIEVQLAAMKQRQYFQTPVTVSDSLPLKQVVIDFQRMNKKATKAARRDQ